MKTSMAVVLVLAMAVASAFAFGSDEYEIFDLVEEVNQNFYEYMGLTQECTSNEIRKAYRKLSLVLHPDRNKAEDASVKFRWLAGIYEVLKDPEKRQIYDRVLVEGLPDWRSPTFYFRRMRKIGLAEGLAYLLVITTVIQHAVHWASYWEQKFTLRENVSQRLNKRSVQKRMKKSKRDEEFSEDKIVEDGLASMGLAKPSVFDLLPFQICRLTKDACVSLPTLPWTIVGAIKDRREKIAEEERKKKEEEEEAERKEKEKKERKAKQKERKIARPKYEERELDHAKYTQVEQHYEEPTKDRPKNAQQLWTDEDIAKLVKLMKKFPGGANDRWERIAEAMERYPWEITAMANNMRGKLYAAPSATVGNKVPGLQSEVEELDSEEDEESSDSRESDDDEDEDDGCVGYTLATKTDYEPVEVKTKTKTKGGKSGMSDEGEETGGQWSQTQQKSFEQALKQFPKGTPERWDRIASKVQGKSKDECISRFKHIAEMVKAKKEEANS